MPSHLELHQNYFLAYQLYCIMGTIKHGVPQGSILGSLLFIIYVYDLPLTINTLSVYVIFANDTSDIISSTNSDDFCML
jgi:hypothetical protein